MESCWSNHRNRLCHKITIISKYQYSTQTDNEIGSTWRLFVTMGKGKELRTPERKSAFLMLESMSKDGVPERGAFTVVGELFQTHRRTMSDLWVKVNSKRADALNNHNNNDGPLPPLAMMEIYARDSNKRHRGKHKFDREELKTKMKEIPLKKRRNLRQASRQLGISLKTTWKFTKEKQANGRSIFW